MKKKNIVNVILVVIIIVLFVLSLTGCAKNAPIASVISVLDLPDGSQLVTKAFTELKLAVMAVQNIGTDEAAIVNGQVLVVSLQPKGTWFPVLNPRGFIAQVTAGENSPGAIMLVTFDDTTGKFTLDCIQGICQLGPDAGHMTNIPVNNEGSLDQSGSFQGPITFDLKAIEAIYGKYIQGGLVAPIVAVVTLTPPVTTETAASTPIFGGTATRTPNIGGITTSTPNIGATATAACKTFHQQFPSTPCP